MTYFERLSPAQQRMLELIGDGYVSFDGHTATAADGTLDLRTFLALLRKGAIRYSVWYERYYLAPKSWSLRSDQRELVHRARALAQPLTEIELQDLVFEVSGNMRLEFCSSGQLREIISRLEGNPVSESASSDCYPFYPYSDALAYALRVTGAPEMLTREVSEIGALATTEARNRELALIHVFAKDRGLDDDRYHAELERITGKRSARWLTAEERQRVIRHLAPIGKPQAREIVTDEEALAVLG